MILILLGTQNKPFTRILKEMEKLVKEGFIKDEVEAQIGSTVFKSKYIKCFDYLNKNEFEEKIKKADIIITHAGVGTIIECLDLKKKVIVVPRRAKYKEHTNDHQIQITKEFENNGYVKAVYNMKDLKDAILNINELKVKKYVSNNDKFKKSIMDYIEDM